MSVTEVMGPLDPIVIGCTRSSLQCSCCRPSKQWLRRQGKSLDSYSNDLRGSVRGSASLAVVVLVLWGVLLFKYCYSLSLRLHT